MDSNLIVVNGITAMTTQITIFVKRTENTQVIAGGSEYLSGADPGFFVWEAPTIWGEGGGGTTNYFAKMSKNLHDINKIRIEMGARAEGGPSPLIRHCLWSIKTTLKYEPLLLCIIKYADKFNFITKFLLKQM